MHSQGICLMALKRSNSKKDWPKTVRQLIFRLRRRVETVFSQLSEQLNAERVLAKSFQGLCTRLTNKILGYNLCLALNYLLNVNCEMIVGGVYLYSLLFDLKIAVWIIVMRLKKMYNLKEFM